MTCPHYRFQKVNQKDKQKINRTENRIMENKSLKEKFKNNILVRPLYRKVGRKIGPKQLISINVDNAYKLEGTDFQVKRQIVSDLNGRTVTNVNILPEVCDNLQKHDKNKAKPVTNNLLISDPNKQYTKMLTRAESDLVSDNSDNLSKNSKTDKYVQAERIVVTRNIPDTWLRVFPLPALPKEGTWSVIFRCVTCQLGLATALTLWTLIWTFLIHSFEGPYEAQVSVEFENAQNQVVIDLATELRQITPLSPKWRESIERRIAEERQLTIMAVSRGARAHSGQFWDLPGTFLFTVYVMTALGFGAPVPHTLWGRSSALVYAFVAVPGHIYLMVNASTCLIVSLEGLCCLRRKIHEGIQYDREQKITTDNTTENQNGNRNSEFVKNSRQGNLRRKILGVLCLPCACRCVPLAALVYYGCGAVAFGVLRDLPAIDTFMFPLEFTTTGGLEHVVGYVRILYGIYVEGAMVLLSCALATLKRHSSTTVNSVAETYRLFQVERP